MNLYNCTLNLCRKNTSLNNSTFNLTYDKAGETAQDNYGLLTVDDIKSVSQLPLFADHLVDILYPLNRKILTLTESVRAETLGSPSGPANSQTNSSNKKTRQVEATFFSSFNYYCGMQLKVWESAMPLNGHKNSKMVFETIKPTDYTGVLPKVFGTLSTIVPPTGGSRSSSGSSKQSSTHFHHFAGNMSRD